MGRMMRVLIRGVAVASLLAWLAVGVLWLRSERYVDQFYWGPRGTLWVVTSHHGWLTVVEVREWPGVQPARFVMSGRADYDVEDETSYPHVKFSDSKARPAILQGGQIGIRRWHGIDTTVSMYVVIVDDRAEAVWLTTDGTARAWDGNPGNIRWRGYRSYTVPLRAVGWVVLIPAGVWLGGFAMGRSRRRRRRLGGRCEGCGYDVRATPGRCPECGWGSPSNSPT
jgi:hypothetical protein